MENKCFTYDEASHVYMLGDSRLTNVTTALLNAGLIDQTWYNDKGKMRGQAVHCALQYLAEGTLDWSSVVDEIKPYIKGALKFETENQVKTIVSEIPLYHPIYLYAGRPDRVVLLNGEVGILDYKTGAAQAWAAIQTAAYEWLVKDLPEVKKALEEAKQKQLRRWALELKNNENYRLISYNDRNDINVFMATLTVNNWLRVHGKGEI